MRVAVFVILAALAACRAAPTPETVIFHYEKSVDGKVRDSSFAETPLRATLGDGMLLPGLEACLRELKEGEERVFVLPPEKAYGPRDPSAVETMALDDFAPEMRSQLVIGAKVYGMRRGKPEKATVLSIAKGVVTLDFNPPDAGKTVTFRLRLVSRET